MDLDSERKKRKDSLLHIAVGDLDLDLERNKREKTPTTICIGESFGVFST